MFHATLTSTIIPLPQNPGIEFISNHSSTSSASRAHSKTVISRNKFFLKFSTNSPRITLRFSSFSPRETSQRDALSVFRNSSVFSTSTRLLDHPAISSKIPGFPRIHFTVPESTRIDETREAREKKTSCSTSGKQTCQEVKSKAEGIYFPNRTRGSLVGNGGSVSDR